MKKLIPSSKAINITLVVLAMLVIGFTVLIFQTKPVTTTATTTTTIISTETSSYDIKILPPIDPMVADTLPHHAFKRKTDSIRHQRDVLNGTFGNSISSYGIGVLKGAQRGVFNRKNEHRKSANMLLLNSFTLDTGKWENPVQYYVKGDKAYLRKTECQLTATNSAGEGFYDCKEADVAVPFRYNTRNKSIMIPIGKTTADVLFIAIPVSLSVVSIVILYFLFGGFIQFLMEIARGNPFSETNVRRLKRMASILFAIPAVVIVFNLLIYLFFKRYFTADVKLSSDIWSYLWKPTLLGLIFTALYFAFRQGKKLKDEQDLTV